jgi:hypothetical protein
MKQQTPRSLLLAAIVLASSLILASAPKGAASEKGAVVKGTLVEKGTLKPVAGRQVLLCKATYDKEGRRILTITVDFNRDTDSQGQFQFSGVPRGTYGLVSFHLMERSELWTADGSRPIDVVVKSEKKLLILAKFQLRLNRHAALTSS